VPHLNKSLARSNKNPFYQGFLTGIVTINLREFYLLSYYITFIYYVLELSAMVRGAEDGDKFVVKDYAVNEIDDIITDFVSSQK